MMTTTRSCLSSVLLPTLVLASATLLTGLGAQAQFVDFSSYTAGSVLGSGSSTNGSELVYNQGVLTDSENAGIFSYRGMANSATGAGATTTTTYSIDVPGSGPAGNYLSFSSTKTGSNGGNPTSFVYSTSAHATTETQVWSMDFSADQLANPSGQVFMGLLSASAYSNGYSSVKLYGANTSTVGMAIRFNASGNLNLYRTGSDNTLQSYNGTTWVSGMSQLALIPWDEGSSGNYRVIISVDGTTGAMNATLQSLDENLNVISTVFGVESNVSDVGSNGTAGGFCYVAGDVGTDTFYGYDLNVYSLSLSDTIPEPSTYAGLAGIMVLGLALLHQRRRPKSN